MLGDQVLERQSAAAPLQAELTLPEPGAPGPFSLSDADQVQSLLTAAGLTAGL
mgnify:CR=1 FL=1